MTDKSIVCVDCGETFVWTVGAQEFFASKGLTNEPKRCPNCAKARKARNNRRPFRPTENN